MALYTKGAPEKISNICIPETGKTFSMVEFHVYPLLFTDSNALFFII